MCSLIGPPFGITHVRPVAHFFWMATSSPHASPFFEGVLPVGGVVGGVDAGALVDAEGAVVGAAGAALGSNAVGGAGAMAGGVADSFPPQAQSHSVIPTITLFFST